MKLTYYGHSCFSVEINDKHILFDPFISPNEMAKAIDVDSIQADYMLITHGHEDHVADAVRIAKKTGCKVVAGYEVAQWFGTQGIENVHALNHGGRWDFDFGWVKFVNAVHSSVLPDGTYGGNAGGWVVGNEHDTFYFAGDTALHLDMQLIPKIAKIDFAILPIGDNFTMGFEDAVIAAKFVECDTIYGCHYDTFDPIKIDHKQAIAAFRDAAKDLILMEIGETIETSQTTAA